MTKPEEKEFVVKGRTKGYPHDTDAQRIVDEMFEQGYEPISIGYDGGHGMFLIIFKKKKV